MSKKNKKVNKKDVQVTPELNEEELMEKVMASLPKDVQNYCSKLRRKVSNCNNRITKLIELVKDMQENYDISQSLVDEHEIAMGILRDIVPKFEDEYTYAIATKEIIEDVPKEKNITEIVEPKEAKEEYHVVTKTDRCLDCIWSIWRNSNEKLNELGGRYCLNPDSGFHNQELKYDDWCIKFQKIGCPHIMRNAISTTTTEVSKYTPPIKKLLVEEAYSLEDGKEYIGWEETLE